MMEGIENAGDPRDMASSASTRKRIILCARGQRLTRAAVALWPAWRSSCWTIQPSFH